MRKVLLGLAAAALVSSSFAAGNDASESGVSRSALKVYSGGVAVGAMFPTNDEFQKAYDKDDLFVASFINSWQFRDNVALFADASYFAPDGFGLDAGVDLLLSTSSVRPFLGAGIGGHYWGKLEKPFGPYLTAHIGIGIDVTETVQARLRVPYHFRLTKDNDQGVGLELGVMFSSKFKNIKKLDY